MERGLPLNDKTLSGFNFENQPFDALRLAQGRPFDALRLAQGRPFDADAVSNSVERFISVRRRHLPRVSCLPENNPGFAHIVRRDLNFYFVARDDADEILSHFSADMGENPLAVWQGYPKHRIGQNFGDRSLDNQRFLLGHNGNCLHKLRFSNGIGGVG
jgi:hypothetical protein